MLESSGRTVVVIENDDSMRDALERLLKAGGFDCAAYARGEPLLTHDFVERIACIVSDLKLPGISGLDLLRALRDRGQSVPFILITAHDAPGLRQQAIQGGAVAYLAKPFRGTALLEAVRASITRPRRVLPR